MHCYCLLETDVEAHAGSGVNFEQDNVAVH